MRNPLRPVRLGLLWVLSGIPLENHTAAIQRIDDAHQTQLARLRRPTIIHNTGGLITDPTVYMPHVDTQAAVRSAIYGGPQ